MIEQAADGADARVHIDGHAVEPVLDGTRMTLTGHYVAPSYPG